MKIEKNHDSLIKAWSMTNAALEIIKETLLENASNVEKAENALYEIMERNNRWYDEIKQMPF